MSPKFEGITYYLPGGFKATYSGDPKTRLQWIWATLDGGFSLWRLWLAVMWVEIRSGHIPSPRRVAELCYGVLELFRIEAEAATNKEKSQ